MLKIAITGNIASGKSQAEYFISKYYPVYDADKLAHEALSEIKDFYGYDVFTDGTIDRKKLGALVFSNNELRKKLEAIIHPKVKSKILKIFDDNKDCSAVFVSVPLLYESGFDKLFDKVILVTANNNIRLQRLMKRNNLTEQEAVLRMNSQMAQEEKIERADYVIPNNSAIEDLETYVNKVLNLILG